MKAGIRHIALACALLVALPSAVSGHSEIVSETPENGTTLETGPIDIVGTFSEDLKPNSRIELRDSSGDVIARGAVDGKTMRIGLEGIQPGTYEVRWVSVAQDDDILRSTESSEWKWTFTVTAASASPTEPSPSPAATATAPASASPSVAASIPTAPPTTPSGTSSGDVLLPIVAALIAVALLAGLLLRRRPPAAR